MRGGNTHMGHTDQIKDIQHSLYRGTIVECVEQLLFTIGG